MLQKKLPYRPLLFVLLITFSFSACQKLQDYVYTRGDADYKSCNIRKVTSISSEDTITYNFTYNSHDNPVSVTHNNVSTGNPNYSFGYDNKNRLVRFVEPYTNGTYFQWQDFEYNNKNQIIKSVAYSFGTIVSNVPQPSQYRSNLSFTYDKQGRIIKVVNQSYVGGTFVNTSEQNYAYDAKGNLADGSVYDNKLNPNRTNAVWMFITRNYSVNNPFIASAYNKTGLPTHCPKTDIVPTFGDVYIDYMCQ